MILPRVLGEKLKLNENKQNLHQLGIDQDYAASVYATNQALASRIPILSAFL